MNNGLVATDTQATWNEACFLREFQQGKNIIDAAAQMAPRIDRLVLSSLATLGNAAMISIPGSGTLTAKRSS